MAEVDPATLDAEARHRIRRIVTDLADDSGDTAPRAAALVAGDQLVWLRLLESPQPLHRALARERLMVLTKQPVEFDPAAEISVRQKQAAAVKAQLTRAE